MPRMGAQKELVLRPSALRGQFVFGGIRKGRLFTADLAAMKKAAELASFCPGVAAHQLKGTEALERGAHRFVGATSRNTAL